MAAWVAVIAAIVSGLFALGTLYLTRRETLKDRLSAADQVAMDFRMPLLAAASDLQARLFNIRRQDFLTRFNDPATSRARPEYQVVNTLYLIGQYFCYAEIIRRGALFLDPVHKEGQRALVEQVERTRDVFASSAIADPTLCIFRGEQRAIGEVMLTETSEAPGRARRWDCMGYATFVERLEEPEVSKWFEHLSKDMGELQRDLGSHDQRLIALQHSLVDLVCLMDPEGGHITTNLRDRL
jgi:hypothetical protein